MLYTIKNSEISVTVSDRGAELHSIKGAGGTEYLWQGDPAYWEDRSPNLFPYIGRMIGKQYEYQGKVYPMEIHGFALSTDLVPVKHTDTELVFQLKSSPETLKQYPWEFLFSVAYSLNGNQLDIVFTVENKDASTMLFAVGGHPGFCVPLSEGECFEDYRLRFDETCSPQRILFTKDCFVAGAESYPLSGGDSIPLHHSLFDEDAIVLKNTSKTVILESKKGGRSVAVSFPQMDYIGFWHAPKTDAPYVCIEPWSSLPSAKGTKTVWEDQQDLLKLEPGAVYTNHWSVMVK